VSGEIVNGSMLYYISDRKSPIRIIRPLKSSSRVEHKIIMRVMFQAVRQWAPPPGAHPADHDHCDVELMCL